jgi:hypothetical protein
MTTIVLSNHLVMMLNMYTRLNRQPEVRIGLSNNIAAQLAEEYLAQTRQTPPEPVAVDTTIEPRVWNKNRSRYGGTCGECFEAYAAGDIVYLTEGTRARHLTCPPKPPDVVR